MRTKAWHDENCIAVREGRRIARRNAPVVRLERHFAMEQLRSGLKRPAQERIVRPKTRSTLDMQSSTRGTIVSSPPIKRLR